MSDSPLFDVLFEHVLELKIKRTMSKYDSIKNVNLSTKKEKIPFLKFLWKNKEIRVLTIEAIESLYVADVLTNDLDVNQIVRDIVRDEKMEIKMIFLDEE